MQCSTLQTNIPPNKQYDIQIIQHNLLGISFKREKEQQQNINIIYYIDCNQIRKIAPSTDKTHHISHYEKQNARE